MYYIHTRKDHSFFLSFFLTKAYGTVWRSLGKMGRFCGDFKIKKLYGFPLEYERDPLNNKSEAETLEEIANKMGYSVAKYIREAVLAYNARNEHMLSRNPKLEQFMGETKAEDYIPMEPTLADYIPIHEDFITKSDFPLEELRRRAQACLYISKQYDKKYQLEKDKAFEKSLHKRHDIELKNEGLGIG